MLGNIGERPGAAGKIGEGCGMSSLLIRHPAQRSSRLSERDSLFEQVEQATPWQGLREPLPVPEVTEDASDAAWDAFTGAYAAVWRVVV